LKKLGYREFASACHEGELARIEVPPSGLAKTRRSAGMRRFGKNLKSLGFRYVTLGLEGFRSGN